MSSKKCYKCKLEKPYNLFHKDISRHDGLTYLCKVCKHVPRKLKIINNHKTCTSCYISLPLTQYFKDPCNSLGYDPKCKVCKTQYVKLKGFNKYNPKYDQTEQSKLYKKQYFLNNKLNIYNRIKQWKLKNPSIKLSYILRVQINNYIRKGKGEKHTSIMNLLGCDINEYKQHIENQFYPEFTWENHGDVWEIDHIIPCALFDLTKIEEQQKCFHYSNQQPLFKTTNIAKSFGYNNTIGNRNKGKQQLKALNI